MQLSENDLFLLCQCAISAATQAGRLINSYSQKSYKIEEKTGGTSLASQVVTEVDFLSQELILQTLEPTCSIYDLALLTEESKDDHSRLEKDYFWCIDPLDGTLPFVEEIPGFSVSIALVDKKGTPLIGVVYDPASNTLYHAIKGKGAFKNGKTCKTSHKGDSTPEKFTFITDRSFLKHPNYNDILKEVSSYALKKGITDLQQINNGGAAMNACWVLENSPACYFKFPKKENGGGSLWDFAATACLLQEAGAVVCDLYGAPLDLNRPDSTFMNHRGVIYASDMGIAKHIIEIYNNIDY